MAYSLEGKKVWVAGHRGMVGGAVARRLESENCEVILAGREIVDLSDQSAVQDWMSASRPDCIVVAAAKVGGIHANNSAPVDFLQNNLVIQNNVLAAAHFRHIDSRVAHVFPSNAASRHVSKSMGTCTQC